jgi:hypothetical protein
MATRRFALTPPRFRAKQSHLPLWHPSLTTPPPTQRTTKAPALAYKRRRRIRLLLTTGY